jgi:mevalonate kinase
MSSSLVISAPGKVLLAGGYLVLDPTYSGVVVSTSSRFYTVISRAKSNCIVVRSPQFINATWSYMWSISRTASPPSVIVSQLARYVYPVAICEILTAAPLLPQSYNIKEQICTSRSQKDAIPRFGIERSHRTRKCPRRWPRRHDRRR